jgi:hypothetical protein
MTHEEPQRCSSISTMRKTSGTSKVLSTNEPPELFVASHLYLFMSGSHSQCHQGTPVFIARAVELASPVPLPDGPAVVLPKVPEAPEPYAFNHPDRIKKFPLAPWKIIDISAFPLPFIQCFSLIVM